MTARVAVVQFPGTNCESDVVEAFRHLGARAEVVWHGDTRLPDVDAVVLPGGFAHGDYLRPGAIARFSELMDPVRRFADGGGVVIGICNGFQILTEMGLLPGALQKNRGLKFLCRTETVVVTSTRSPLTSGTQLGERLELPINHFEGNFTCDDDVLDELREQDRIVLRYDDNPNGSTDDIAGICNVEGNVVGLMPHPERAYHRLLGSTDGARLLESVMLAVAPVSA